MTEAGDGIPAHPPNVKGSTELDWHHILRLAISRDGGCDRMRPIAMSEVTGWRVMDVSLRWCGQASVTALELRPSGARQRPDRAGRTPRTTAETDHGEREIIMSMRHAAPKHSNAATRRPSRRGSEIILATIIYLTASCFAVIGTLGVVAVVWTLWGAIGVR